jgi:hypothetical protein
MRCTETLEINSPPPPRTLWPYRLSRGGPAANAGHRRPVLAPYSPRTRPVLAKCSQHLNHDGRRARIASACSAIKKPTVRRVAMLIELRGKPRPSGRGRIALMRHPRRSRQGGCQWNPHVDIGAYRSSRLPQDPILVHLVCTPCEPKPAGARAHSCGRQSQTSAHLFAIVRAQHSRSA